MREGKNPSCKIGMNKRKCLELHRKTEHSSHYQGIPYTKN